ncbi:MAG: HAMP domain-containing protein [Actinobacteria bacterium]|nr:HAMP domain-containing protein [Actinomycetota bacterium]
MKLRTRVAVLTAAVTAITVVLVSVSVWAIANRQLVGTVDDQLDERAESIGPSGQRGPGRFLAGDVAQQLILDNGVVSTGELVIVPNDDDFAVANGRASRSRSTTTGVTDGGEEVSVRVLTVRAHGTAFRAPVRAVMLARPLTEVEESLARLRRALVVLSSVGVVIAGLAGLLIADRAMRPIGRLTRAVEDVARTTDLDTEIAVERTDELGRLAGSFNAMLGALRKSRDQQERLVYDASHELRTPLTSLRTNIEVLQRVEHLSFEERAPVLDDVLLELDELTSLVTELVDLATDQHEAADVERIDLGLLVTMVVERHRRRTDLTIELTSSECEIIGAPALVERAVSNLIDNAIKFSPDAGTVRVSVVSGRVMVSDEGPGIAAADRDSVFERFWRADEARAMPGSGLGLSIVAQVAHTHGGSVAVVDGQTTGATIELVFPEPADG